VTTVLLEPSEQWQPEGNNKIINFATFGSVLTQCFFTPLGMLLVPETFEDE